jgi:hypothetical protein
MNLPLNGFTWRTVLRAVPEPSRLEILGTLTECYGPSAPLSEAFRTFTSGSRMHNRANASSPIDLWREAARNATAFMMIFYGMLYLGGRVFAQKWDHREPFWQAAPWVIFGIFGLAVQRGRFLRFAGFTMAASSSASLFLVGGMPSRWRTPTLSMSTRLAAIGLLASIGVLLLVARIAPKQRLLISAASIVLIPNGLRFLENKTAAHYDPLPNLLIVQSCILYVAVIGWTRSNEAKTAAKVWWPSLLGMLLGTVAMLSESRFSGAGFSIAGKVIVVALIGSGVSSVLLATVRPQVLLLLGVVFARQAVDLAQFINWHPSEWSLGTAFNFLTPLAPIAFAIAASKRSLRQY